MLNCKKIFETAYKKRYTWPDNFNGYKGTCHLNKDNVDFDGIFSVSGDFKVNLMNIEEEEIVKIISSQLFEVNIHRVKRDFEKVHLENNFQFLKDEGNNGITMSVTGKNEGDKYRVMGNKINMVFRNIHGFIIEIFVDQFLDTGSGSLATKYTSQQLNKKSLKPISPKYIYLDEFINLDSNLWLLKRRTINHINDRMVPIKQDFIFDNLTLLSN